jgi:hypothetical protein
MWNLEQHLFTTFISEILHTLRFRTHFLLQIDAYVSNCHEGVRRSGGMAPSHLNIQLGGGELRASSSSRFNLGERIPIPIRKKDGWATELPEKISCHSFNQQTKLINIWITYLLTALPSNHLSLLNPSVCRFVQLYAQSSPHLSTLASTYETVMYGWMNRIC